MFGTSDLQALIEKVDGGQQGVDLVKIGQNFSQQGSIEYNRRKSIFLILISNLLRLAPTRNPRRMRVALDIEGCLDRFYGGYYSGESKISRSICRLMTKTTTTTISIFQIGLAEDNSIAALNSFNFSPLHFSPLKSTSLSSLMELLRRTRNFRWNATTSDKKRFPWVRCWLFI